MTALTSLDVHRILTIDPQDPGWILTSCADSWWPLV
jgi:hypothetical protein